MTIANARVGGPAADDADGAQEFHPVGVDIGFGGSAADQGRDGVVGEQLTVDLLADHVRALGPQYRTGAAQAGLELIVAGVLFPALAVGLGQFLRGGGRGVGDGGDQGDQLAAATAVAVTDLVLDDPHPHRLARVEVLARAGGRGNNPDFWTGYQITDMSGTTYEWKQAGDGAASWGAASPRSARSPRRRDYPGLL